MRFKYLHLIINSNIRYNLKNLIGNSNDHKIVVVGNDYKDIDLNGINDSVFESFVDNAKVIFVHFLNERNAKIINRLKSKKKIIWFCWGADLYYLGGFENQFLLKKTRLVRFKIGLKSYKGFKDLLKSILGRFSDYIPPNKHVLKAFNKIDLIIPVVQQDYEMLLKNYNVKAGSFNINYLNNVFFQKPEVQEGLPRKNIMLGNSASFSNNHVELIDHLSRFDLKDRKVFIPLSYGNRNYAEYVQEYAKKHLGKPATILNNYLPFEQYIQILNSCESVIMNHCRQQALGNIILALWFESNVFLNSKSGLYDHLIEKGFHILKTENYAPKTSINKAEKKENKELLLKNFGPVYSKKRFEDLLCTIENL